VLNAGISKSADARERFAARDFRDVYNVNVFGLANWIEAVLPDMLQAGAGGFRQLVRLNLINPPLVCEE